MSAVRATWQNGEVVLEGRPDWSEGRQLIVVELPEAARGDNPNEDWSNTPEAIAEWLKWYDDLKPLIFTPEEEADTQAWLKLMSAHAITSGDKGIEDVFR